MQCGLSWRPDDSFVDFLNVLKETVAQEAEEPKSKIREVPDTMQPQEKPNIDAEDYSVEDYSEEDLNKPNAKPKSKSQKDPRYAVRQVADKEVENPKVTLKDSTEVKEGIFELLGEIPGISLLDQAAVRAMVRSGKISVDWPSEDQMIDELSKLEDFVEPSKLGPETDLKQEYLKHVIVPKAIIWDKARECRENLQKTLYLCNNCCKTFRADEAVCSHCGSKLVENVTNELPEKVYRIHGNLGKQYKRFIVDADTKEEAVEKVQKRYPDFVVQKILGESKKTKLAETKYQYLTYFTAEGQGKHMEVSAYGKEEAAAEVKRIFPDAVIQRMVEESKVNETKGVVGIQVKQITRNRWDVITQEEFGSGDTIKQFDNLEDARKKAIEVANVYEVPFQGIIYLKESKVNEQADWDLTFKYTHDDIHSNPLLDREGNPWIWARHPMAGKRVRVFSDYQANWVERQDANPVLEKPSEEKEPGEEPSETEPAEGSDQSAEFGDVGKRKQAGEECLVKEQETEVTPKGYQVAGRGLEEPEARDLAARKNGSAVPDDQNKDKFMVLVKEKSLEEGSEDEKIVGKTPSGEEVSVPAKNFLNALAKGVGETGYGYWFSGETGHEDRQIFEFISTKAPKIEIVVYGKMEQE